MVSVPGLLATLDPGNQEKGNLSASTKTGIGSARNESVPPAKARGM